MSGDDEHELTDGGDNIVRGIDWRAKSRANLSSSVKPEETSKAAPRHARRIDHGEKIGSVEVPGANPPEDAEFGAVAAARLYGREPDQTWRYANIDGATAFYVLRFTTSDGDGADDVRTLSWRSGIGWLFATWSERRPLYHIDVVAAREKALVLICGDERDADAAEEIFGAAVIATCCNGGWREAEKSDWTPLAGRKVLIWSQAVGDDQAVAQIVGAILARQNCDVSIVDAPALAALSPQRALRQAPAHWGPVDAVTEWSDMPALRLALADSARRFEPPPAYVSHGGFEMTAAGLYADIEIGSGKNCVVEKIWLSSPFEILRASRDAQGRDWGKELHFRDADKREHSIVISDAMAHNRPAAVCQTLVGLGLKVAPDAYRQLARYLAGAQVEGRLTLVSRTGWHMLGQNAVFVLPHRVVGAASADIVRLDAVALGAYAERGDLHAWRNGVGALASGHVLAVLAICAAFAGALLRLAGFEGGGVHFYGASSKGKSTIAYMAASVWGRGAPGGFIHSWRATANGLEGAATGASDTALVLDELGQAEARDAAAMLYALANGGGKSRAASNGNLVEPKSWIVMTISTGEISVAMKLAEDSRRNPRAGQLVRLLDVPVDRAFGAFDHPGPDGDSAKLARACQRAAVTNYGVAGPEFAQKIVDFGISGDVVRQGVEAFVRDHAPTKSDGQVERAAQRFGLIAVAGEFATLFGITPWREGEAVEAAAWALAEWIARRGGVEPAEARFAIDQVRAFISGNASRFEDLDDPNARPVCNRAGWRKGGEWWVSPNIWRTEVCEGLDPVFVARILAERGVLRRQGGNEIQCAVNIGGAKRARAYVLTAAVLDAAEPEG